MNCLSKLILSGFVLLTGLLASAQEKNLKPGWVMQQPML
jgi:hypothetical protein